ncbi:MAG: hypothetical protein EPO57_02855, partial [Chitinophagaceae bacterium]
MNQKSSTTKLQNLFASTCCSCACFCTTMFLRVSKVISILLFMAFSFLLEAAAQQPKANLDQARDGGSGGGTPIPENPISWVNGNLGASNSHYREAYSVPYRAVLENLPNDTISLIISYDIKHSSRNAIDFLTYYKRNEPHLGWTPPHVQEDVFPTSGVAGTLTAGVGFPIPAPTINAAYLPPTALPQPSSSFAALPAGERLMSIWNGTILSMAYVSQGDLTAAQSIATIRVTFLPNLNSTTVILAWGGHIGSRHDWGYDALGVPRSAGGISGSPYHMRLESWGLNNTGVQDGTLPNLGNTDRSLSAAAVFVPPPTCDDVTITGPTPVCPGSINIYNASVSAAACANTSTTYSWAFSVNNTGATFVGSTTGSSVSINAGTACGFDSVCVTITCTEGTVTCCYRIDVVDVTAPVFTFCPPGSNLGCNPQGVPAAGQPTATDNCAGPIVLTDSLGLVVVDGCNRTQTRYYKATDGCGNSSTCTQVFTWIV